MWTCPKCNTPVEPPRTVCRTCGTAAEDTASTAIQANGSAPLPAPVSEAPPLQAVVPPSKPETFLDRALAGALAGAIWGALYGALFALINYMILSAFGAIKQEAWLTDFPIVALKSAGVIAVVMALVGALLRQVTGRKRPPTPPK